MVSAIGAVTYPYPHDDPRTLSRAPELAILAALEASLSLAVRALVAEHPTLDVNFCPEERRAEPPTLRHARRILRRIASLQQTLDSYRRAALDALAPPAVDEDEPF